MSRLPSAAAPGFVYLAGACRGVPVGGGGRDLAEAAARLAGETAEVLAQLAAPAAAATLPGDPAIDALWTAAPAPLRVAGVERSTGRPVGVPAAAIFLDGRAAAERGGDGAAGEPRPRRRVRTAAAARLAALLELIERDAAARLVERGRRPRASSTPRAGRGRRRDLAELRAGRRRAAGDRLSRARRRATGRAGGLRAVARRRRPRPRLRAQGRARPGGGGARAR